MSIEWINVAAGFLVGLMVGLTGVGGGALMTPILVLMFGMAPSAAVGTDLWFAAITKMVGGWVHGKKGTIDWQVLRRLFLGSIPASLLTLLWLHLTQSDKLQSVMMTKLLGVVLILTSIASVFRPYFFAIGRRMRLESPTGFKRWQPLLTVMGGALIGFLVTFTSIGAGALGAVILLYLYPLRMSPSTLVGTDIVHAIPLTVLAGLGHMLMGNVKFDMLGMLLVGSIPGIIVGSLGSAYAPERVVRTAISVVLVAVGVKMLWF